MHLPATSKGNLPSHLPFLQNHISLYIGYNQLVIAYRTMKNIGIKPEVQIFQLI